MRLADVSSGLTVLLGDSVVGTLARNADGFVLFQYDPIWVARGFSINPYSLPLSNEVFVPEWEPFGGLFGVFHDSLPDGWGALLLDRMLRREGMDPSRVDNLTRLAIVGSNGRGALRYEPHADFELEAPDASLDDLARWCQDILEDRSIDDLDAAYVDGGSSGGARPKAYVEDNQGVSWLVKFPSSMDPKDIGQLEYDYALTAASCGIQMPEARLFPSRLCKGYFGTRRFDIGDTGERIHMVSASGIVEVSHRVPALDYESLFQISSYLGGEQKEARRLFCLMCFNVFAHNQDDHSNNFAWLCENGVWRLSPAYDLTYSSGLGHMHATSVLGNPNPGMAEVLALAREAGLPSAWAKRTAASIRHTCSELLRRHGLAE